jgi:hypothetical protein
VPVLHYDRLHLTQRGKPAQIVDEVAAAVGLAATGRSAGEGLPADASRTSLVTRLHATCVLSSSIITTE